MTDYRCWDERVVLGVWGDRTPKEIVAKRYTVWCDMYGGALGMADKRGALEDVDIGASNE